MDDRLKTRGAPRRLLGDIIIQHLAKDLPRLAGIVTTEPADVNLQAHRVSNRGSDAKLVQISTKFLTLRSGGLAADQDLRGRTSAA
jgi:hypothetical protein